MDLIERDALLLKQKAHVNLFSDSTVHDDIVRRDEATAALAEIINAPAVNRWIPCSEALPASICRVLVTTFAGNVGVAVFNPEKKRWYKNGEFYDLCLIIAWQPMPDAYEPPKE